MTRRLAFSSVSLVLLAAAPGCDGGPDLLAPEPCPGDTVTLDVRTGSEIDFVWAPACPVAWLEVFDDGTNANAWVLSGRGENAIRPIVRYGQRPAAALQLSAPTSLTPGRPYVVRVLRLVGSGPVALLPAGSATFTP